MGILGTLFKAVIIIILAIVGYSYAKGISVLQTIDLLCGGCVKRMGCANCPACNMARGTGDILKKFAMGCTKQLRGVMKADMISESEIRDFLNAGKHKLVLIANTTPDILVSALNGAEKLETLKLVTISSSIVAGQKVYLIMSMTGGELNPVGSPTRDYAEASKYFSERADKDVGKPGETIVMFIDEDISCDMPEPPRVEKCCGTNSWRW